MPPKAARKQEERQSGERFCKVVTYCGENYYATSEPMPETQARYMARMAERQDSRMHASIVPTREER
mgnify:CR=1 FL=1